MSTPTPRAWVLEAFRKGAAPKGAPTDGYDLLSADFEALFMDSPPDDAEAEVARYSAAFRALVDAWGQLLPPVLCNVTPRKMHENFSIVCSIAEGRVSAASVAAERQRSGGGRPPVSKPRVPIASRRA